MVIPALCPYDHEEHLVKIIGAFSTNGLPAENEVKDWLKKNGLLRLLKEKHHCPQSKRKKFPWQRLSCISLTVTIIITSQLNAVQCLHILVPSCKIFPNILLSHSLTISISRNLRDPLRSCMLGWNSKFNMSTFVQESTISDLLLCTFNQFHVDILHLSKLLPQGKDNAKCG